MHTALLLTALLGLAPAPEVFTVRLETTRGAIVIECVRAWAPNGADRFYELVASGYFNDAAVFRVRPKVFAQFGINALAFELPFHGRRRPMKSSVIHNLISDDLCTMVEGVRHCLADILALRLWLLEQGCPTVSLWGYSLGGWLAGLLTAHPQPFEAAVLQNAVARMDIALATLPFAGPAREGMAQSPLDLDVWSLRRLTQTTRRTLIMEGVRDLFVPAETIEDLAQHWPRAELWRLNHSHISIVFGALSLLRAVRWLKKEVVEHGH